MGFLKRWEYLKEVKRWHGLREMLTVAFVAGSYRGSKRLLLIILDHPQPIPKAVEASRSHRFFFAEPEELERFQDPAYEISGSNIQQVRDGTSLCLLQLDGDVLVGYSWVWTSKLAYIEDGVYINLPDSAVYNYKGYTNPIYRGFGFQGLRHLKLLEHFKKEGVTCLFAFVNRLNTKSLHGVKKSGYQVIGELLVRHRKGRVHARLSLPEWFWPGKETSLTRHTTIRAKSS